MSLGVIDVGTTNMRLIIYDDELKQSYLEAVNVPMLFPPRGTPRGAGLNRVEGCFQSLDQGIEGEGSEAVGHIHVQGIHAGLGQGGQSIDQRGDLAG